VLPTANEIQCVKSELDRLPDVREDRVMELKARIESGAYRISADDIADLIVRRALADGTAV
jgi:negative regulator of flagellin synthesis FlgM